jgi:hypothetical protein
MQESSEPENVNQLYSTQLHVNNGKTTDKINPMLMVSRIYETQEKTNAKKQEMK